MSTVRKNAQDVYDSSEESRRSPARASQAGGLSKTYRPRFAGGISRPALLNLPRVQAGVQIHVGPVSQPAWSRGSASAPAPGGDRLKPSLQTSPEAKPAANAFQMSGYRCARDWTSTLSTAHTRSAASTSLRASVATSSTKHRVSLSAKVRPDRSHAAEPRAPEPLNPAALGSPPGASLAQGLYA
jgi:hypothetical protein